MSWNQVHRRYELVQQTTDAVFRYGPKALDEWREALDAEYGGLDGWLRDIQRRWYTTFDAHLDGVLADAPYELDDAIADAWRRVARMRPELHAVLTTFADHPALVPGRQRHRRLLSAATGVDETRHDQAAPVLAA